MGDVVDTVLDVVNYIGYVLPLVNAGYSYWGMAIDAMMPNMDLGNSDYEESRKRMIRTATAPRITIYGETIISGPLAYVEVSGSSKEYLNLVILLAGHEVQEIGNVYLNDVISSDSKFNGLVTINKHLGTPDQTADATLMAQCPTTWTSAHRLRGIAYLYVQLKYDKNTFATGIPKITAQVKGKKVYDTRTSTTAYSNNPALCVRDWLLTTGKADATEIDSATTSDAANYCDTLINGAKRFTCNGLLEHKGKATDGLRKLLSSMAGSAYYRQGKWYIYPASYEAPVVTLTESDLTGSIQVVTRGDKTRQCNTVTGKYYPADKNYEQTDFPPVTSSAYIADDLEELSQDLDLAFTTDNAQAQRIAKIVLEQSRRTMACQFPAKFTALRLAPPCRVSLNIAQLGWNGQVFRVSEFGAALRDGVTLALVEDSADVYTWTPGEETTLPAPPATQLPDPTHISPPTGLQVTESTYTTNTPGVVMGKATLSWTSGDAMTDTFIIQGKGPGDSVARELGRTDSSVPSWDHYDPKPGLWTYYVYAQSVLGVLSTAASTTVTLSGVSTPPATVTGFAVTPRPGGIARLTWSPNNETNILEYNVKSGASWATGTYVAQGATATSVDIPLNASGAITYWIKARSTALVESTTAASVTFTPSLTTPGAFTITPGIGTARIAWSDTADTYKAGYEVQIAPDSSGAPGTWATVQKGLATGYTYTGTPGTPVWVRVRAYDGAGNVSAWNTQTQFTPDYVKALDSANVPTGYNLQINSDFDAGTLDGWQLSQWGSLPTVVTATTPRSGKYAARNPANTAASIQGVRMIPCNPDRAYILEAYAATISGATGTFYLRVYFYTAAGAATTPAYLSAAEAVAPGVTPTFYSKVFGAGQTDALPSGAVYMRPVVILNYNNGDRIMETQGVRIREMIESLYVKNASMTDADILNVSASKIVSGSVTSQTITLALTEGAGDVAIKAGKTDFGDNTAGIILGMDDSDGNLPKLEIGDATDYLKYRPGTGLQVAGSITITGGSGYGNLTDRPTSLNDINAAESNILGSVQPGATNTLRYAQATDPIPLHPTFTRASTAYLANGTQIASGKPRIEPGKFGGAIMVEEGTSNLLLPGQYNASDTTLFSVDTDCVLSLETTSPISGASSIKCVTPAVAVKRLYFSINNKPAVTAGLAYSGQMLVKGSGTVTFVMRAYNSSNVAVGDSASIDVTLTATPQLIKIENFIIPTGGVNLQIIIGSKNAEVCTIIADCYQLEAKSYATSFIDGTRAVETLLIDKSGLVSDSLGTIEVWAKTNIDRNNYQMPFNAWQRFYVSWNGSGVQGRLTLSWVDTGGVQRNVTVDTGLPHADWHHYALAWTADKMMLYLDGILKIDTLRDYGATTFKPFPTNYIDLGSTSYIPYPFDGVFDSVRLSNIARTDAEILASATSGLPMERDAYTTALFDFNTGIEWLNNGTLKTYNGVAWEDAATWGATLGTSLFKGDGSPVTTITPEGIYTGLVVADQVQTGGLRGINVNAASHTTKGSYLTQACAAGATTLYVHNTADFPTSGEALIIDALTDDGFSYTGKTSTSLTGCVGVGAHSPGTTIIPKTKLALIDSLANEMRIYEVIDDTQRAIVRLGGSGGKNSWLTAGDSSFPDSQTRMGIYGGSNENYGVFGESSYSFGVVGWGQHGVKGTGNPNGGIGAPVGVFGVATGDYSVGVQGGDGITKTGGFFMGVTAPITLYPSTVSSAPTHTADKGSLWVTSTGVLYINTSGSTTWQKVGAQ